MGSWESKGANPHLGDPGDANYGAGAAVPGVTGLGS